MTLVVTQYVVVPSIVLVAALMIWLGAGFHFIRLAVRTARDDGAGPSRATALGLRALVKYVFYFAP